MSTAISAFVFNTGQFCMSGSRLLVERPVYESVIAALAGALPTSRWATRWPRARSSGRWPGRPT